MTHMYNNEALYNEALYNEALYNEAQLSGKERGSPDASHTPSFTILMG